MRIDGIQLQEGSAISNMSVANGTSFPSSPNDGELFYRTDGGAPHGIGLYLYTNGAWSALETQGTGDADYVNVSGDTMTGSLTAPAFIPNSATVPTNGLFLSAANTIGFSTNTSERARFDSSGNLLIGTTTLNQKITLAGGSMIIDNAQYYYSKSTIPTSVRMLGINASNVAYVGPIDSGPTSTQINASSSSTSLQINTGGTAALSIDSSQQVGIGVVPSVRFHILDSNSEVVRINTSNSTGGYQSFQTAGTTQGLIGAGSTLFTNSAFGMRAASGVPISFSLNSTTPAVTIDTSGNLLIGTTSQQAGGLLCVGGASGSNHITVAGGAGAGLGGYVGFYGQGANTGYIGTDAAITGSGTSNDISIYAAGSTQNTRIYTNSVERMRIDSSGRLLIGTTTAPLGASIQQVVSSTSSGGLQLDRGPSSGGAAFVANSGGGVQIYSYTGAVGSETYTERVRIDSAGNVGIGTTSPNTKLAASSNTTNALPSTFSGTLAQFVGTDSAAARLQINGFAGQAVLTMVYANGTNASPSAVASGNDLAVLNFTGYKATGYSSAAAAQIVVSAPATWTDSSTPTVIKFSTTPSASTTLVEAVRIDSAGNVGIGNTNPAVPLEVTSNSGSHALRLRGRSDNYSTLTFTSNDGATTYAEIESGSISSYGLNIQTDTAAKLTLGTNSTERMRIDSSGNIGINNSVTRGKLYVNENSSTSTTPGLNPVLWVGGSNGATTNGLSEIGFTYGVASGGDPGNKVPATIGIQLTSVSGFTKGDLTFCTRSVTTDTAPTERMRIDSSGNVGIGRTDSSYPLSIRLTTATTNAVVDVAQVDALSSGTATSTFGSRLLFSAKAANGNSYNVAGIAGVNASSSNAGQLAFYTNNAGTLTEAARIDNAGNVGIGTTGPSYRLQIGDSTVSTANRIQFGKAQTASESNLPVIGQQSAGVGNDLALASTSTSGVIRFFTGASTNSGEFGTGSNAERMRLDASGNLLLGTTTNGGRLSVSGTSGSTIGNFGIAADGDRGVSIIATGSGAVGTGMVTSNGGSYQLLFGINGVEAARINLSGNFGIGATAGASERLRVELNQNNPSYLRLANTTSGTASNATFLLTSDGGSSFLEMNSSTHSTKPNQLWLFNNVAAALVLGTSGAEQMRIDSAGLVGIGTTNPSTLLHVKSTTTNVTVSAETTVATAFQQFAAGANNGTAATIHNLVYGTTGSGGTRFGASNGGMAMCYADGSALTSLGVGTTTNTPLILGTNDAERMRVDGSGNVLIGATSTAGNGNFTNKLGTAVLSRSTASGNSIASWSQSYYAAATNNATVDSFLFKDAAGTGIGGAATAGHFYVNVQGASAANQFSGIYTLVATGNGTTNATFTAVSTVTKGTSPVSSVQIANDGGGGGVKVTITYINNSGVVTGGFANISFVGLIS